jgi:hypothetical protein
MKLRTLFLTSLVFGFAMIFGMSANAQIVDKTKDAASKVKDVTVKTAKKTTSAVADAVDDSASKTKQAAKVGAAKAQKFGSTTVSVTENIAGDAYEGGRYLTVTTWDGVKWVSKRQWFPNKKNE